MCQLEDQNRRQTPQFLAASARLLSEPLTAPSFLASLFLSEQLDARASLFLVQQEADMQGQSLLWRQMDHLASEADHWAALEEQEISGKLRMLWKGRIRRPRWRWSTSG